MQDTGETGYTAVIKDIAVSLAQDVFEIVAGSEVEVDIDEVRLSQVSDAGDAASELLSVQIIRGHAVAGNGTAVTPRPLKSTGRAATTTVLRNGTTLASGGTPVDIVADGWNIMAGWWWGKPEDHKPGRRINLAPGQRAVIRLPNAPTDALTLNATVAFTERGVRT